MRRERRCPIWRRWPGTLGRPRSRRGPEGCASIRRRCAASFDGPDPALGLVAGEPDGQVGGEPQDHVLAVAEPVGQPQPVAGGLAAAPRVVCDALAHRAAIPGAHLGELGAAEAGLPGGAGGEELGAGNVRVTSFADALLFATTVLRAAAARSSRRGAALRRWFPPRARANDGLAREPGGNAPQRNGHRLDVHDVRTDHPDPVQQAREIDRRPEYGAQRQEPEQSLAQHRKRRALHVATTD